jgi:hypothetical protein
MPRIIALMGLVVAAVSVHTPPSSAFAAALALGNSLSLGRARPSMPRSLRKPSPPMRPATT